MKDVVIGVWAGAPVSELLASVGLPGERQVPVLRITLRRLHRLGLPVHALIPWNADRDPLAADVKGWGYNLQRTHSDQRIAMRDLVASYGASIGVLVEGTAAVIDQAEIELAIARKVRGVGDQAYISPRMKCLPAEVWLLPNDTDEWVEPMDARELSKFYAGQDFDQQIGHVEARAIKARKST